MELKSSFTSTGEKLFLHQSAMQALRDGGGKPIHGWLNPHDSCNARCSFCSVGERVGDTLSFNVIKTYFSQLTELGLKAVTISGGGNPCLYRCKETGADFNDLVDFLHCLGLQIGVITNGMPMKEYHKYPDANSGFPWRQTPDKLDGIIMSRTSWKSVHPETLDKLTWCRISMAGLDANHKEQEVYVPDFDPTKTTLGFSWIMSDSYEEPSHKHGWVSTPEDIKWTKEEMANFDHADGSFKGRKVVYAVDRLPWIEEQIKGYVEKHNPGYVRLLCNCLQPERIPERHAILTEMANRIDPSRCFSQNKPPRQPAKCWKVLPHPCLSSDGWVYPCDSVVLNKSANHQFGSQWRICRADQIKELYENPKAFNMPDGICPGCVFSSQVNLINQIVEHGMETPFPDGEFQHPNFV